MRRHTALILGILFCAGPSRAADRPRRHRGQEVIGLSCSALLDGTTSLDAEVSFARFLTDTVLLGIEAGIIHREYVEVDEEDVDWFEEERDEDETIYETTDGNVQVFCLYVLPVAGSGRWEPFAGPFAGVSYNSEETVFVYGAKFGVNCYVTPTFGLSMEYAPTLTPAHNSAAHAITWQIFYQFD